MIDLFVEELKTNPSERIFIVGLPLAGKTTFGMKLAQYLHIPFYDLDKEICHSIPVKDVSTFFTLYGEQAFRVQEHKTLRQFLQKQGPYVLATGGGTACQKNHMQIMNQLGHTLYIYLSWENFAKRLKNAARTYRPLLKDMPRSAPALSLRFLPRIKYYEQAQTTYRSTSSLSANTTHHR